jgi:hypothetical protein
MFSPHDETTATRVGRSEGRSHKSLRLPSLFRNESTECDATCHNLRNIIEAVLWRNGTLENRFRVLRSASRVGSQFESRAVPRFTRASFRKWWQSKFPQSSSRVGDSANEFLGKSAPSRHGRFKLFEKSWRVVRKQWIHTNKVVCSVLLRRFLFIRLAFNPINSENHFMNVVGATKRAHFFVFFPFVSGWFKYFHSKNYS